MAHVIIGAGMVGTELARLLAARGEQVKLVSRSGSGPRVSGIELVSADASQATELLRAQPTASAVYNCANPRNYYEWSQDFPPLGRALLEYAEHTGAVLATVSNLYGYGPVEVPMVESLPLVAQTKKGRIRADMWREAKEWHDAGRVRVTEVRGSDYICASDQSAVGSERVVPRILAGKSVSLLGGLDWPHTWTAPRDVARLLAIVATDQRAWGRAWHVPSNPAKSQREVINDLADVADVARVRVSQVPYPVLWAIGVFSPLFKEFREMNYQTDRPFILDDSAARSTFGLEPTAWSEVLGDLVAHYRNK